MSGAIDALSGFLAGRPRLAVITGAGCSTASGIGDYRDMAGGWKRRPPIQMQDFMRDPAARRRYWARSMLGWPQMAVAGPNPAHRALAELEAAGAISGLITQNVDGLHQQAGHRNLIELHGCLADVVCMGCGVRESRARLQAQLEARNAWLLSAAAPAAPDGDADLADTLALEPFEVPDCPECGGLFKPDVVFYGDTVPRARVTAAYALVEQADAVLVVGSSLMVYSSFRFCRRARELGIPLVAINRGRTRADDWYEIKVEADCSTALPAFARVRLTEMRRPSA
jgi:NAD-dependent SIR2 family protein deacetylase